MLLEFIPLTKCYQSLFILATHHLYPRLNLESKFPIQFVLSLPDRHTDVELFLASIGVLMDFKGLGQVEKAFDAFSRSGTKAFSTCHKPLKSISTPIEAKNNITSVCLVGSIHTKQEILIRDLGVDINSRWSNSIISNSIFFNRIIKL